MSSVVGNGSSTTVALKIQPSATKKFSLCGCCRPPNRRAKFIEEVDAVYLPNGAGEHMYKPTINLVASPLNSTFKRPMNIPEPSTSIWHSQTKQQNGFSKHNTTAVQPTTTKVESITLTSCPLAPSTSKTSTEINSSKGRLRNNSDVEHGSLAGFETARTSRHEETSRYISMAQLVGKIREEAGLVDTPRPAPLTPTIDSNGVNELTNSTPAVSTQIKELRVENLVKSNLQLPSSSTPTSKSTGVISTINHNRPKRDTNLTMQVHTPSLRGRLATMKSSY